MAVEWNDISYERRAIWIEDQITFDEEGNKIESEVKTEESEGWVYMPRCNLPHELPHESEGVK
ncbi:site-specific integrase [Paenibacillus chitinolyticus]|uniref:hypothetical protein n=1 Tax=Paenibacillus chitinolyticus TaxID=79263 RepID=UPI00363E7015